MHHKAIDMLEKWEKLGHRNALGESLVLLGAQYPELCTLTADLTPTARLTGFKEAYPDRFFDVGIAEQNMIDFSAGLAKEGLIPFAVTIAAFAPMRCAEQIRMALGYMNLNVKVVGIEAGMRFGPLGNTHCSMDDIALIRAIPNFTIMTPSDVHQVYKALAAAAEHKGPVYIRLTGGPGHPLLYPEDFDFQIGKAIEYRSGNDLTFISTGSVLAEVIKAADMLQEKGISTRIIDMHTIKPLDKEMLDQAFEKSKVIITVEEHSAYGGLGGAVAEYKAGITPSPKQIICSLGDSFKKLGDHAFHLKTNGLTAPDLAAVAEKNL